MAEGKGIELGKAYVQIVPSAKGIQGKITEELGGESSRAGETAGQLFGDKLVGTIKKVLGTAAIGKVITDSINAGGALQQSLGGVETLFKDSADRVKAYAAQAYKTAGLSANDYMETTTSFAASLLSSVSNDTDAAAQLVDMAMKDMSDNSNKMGTDMQDIQNAYQGFAKSNYTMLDNLKIGYGGTQAEMQRLLKDAEKISGVHYDLGNLADMYSAIHIIQTELDITGTTAKEASTTLTGSFSAMGAAFQNTLGNLALGEDLQPSLEALIETARTYLVDNLIPLVGNVVSGIPEVIAALAPAILQTGTELVQNFTSGFAQGIPEFLASALPAVLSFTEELRANFGDFVTAGIDLILSIANGLVEGLPQLFAYIPDIVINIAGLINDNAPKILAGAVGLMVTLGKGLIDSVPLIIQNAGKIVEAVVSVISAFNWLNLGANLIKGLANGVKSMGGELLNAFKGGFSSALAWIKNLPSQAVQWGKNLIQSFINGITGTGTAASIATAGIGIAKNAAKDTGEWSLSDDVADKAEVNALRMKNLSKAVEDTIPAYTKSGNAAAAAAKKASSAAKTAASVVNSYSDTVTELVGNMTRTTQTVTEEMSDHTTQHKQVITETSRQMVEGVLKDIKTVITVNEKGQKSIQQTMETVRETSSTVTSTFDSVVNGIKTNTQTITETLTDGTETTKQVITETYTDVINGALVTVERIKNIAADGTEQVAETIKDSSAKTLDGLWSEIKDRANEGILGTVGTLWDAVKNGDWLGIGKWAASALYAGLTADQKQALQDFALNMVSRLNDFLGQGAKDLAQGAVNIGQSLVNGITGGFDNIVSLAGQLGSTLTTVFSGLKAPLSAAATAISTGLSTGLTSQFPTIATAVGALITAIGGAFTAMLDTIGGVLTGLGIPTGSAMIAAGIALAAAIAGIVALVSSAFGGSSRSSVKTPTNSSSSASSAITDTSRSLWDYEKESARPERRPRPSYEINQYIYSKAQTAADLMREARYEQERAVLAGV